MNRIGRGRRLGPLGLGIAFLLALVAQPRPAAAQESWDAVYIAGHKVGYINTKVEPVKDRAGRDLSRVQVHTVLTFKRLTDTVTMQMRYGTIETPEGAVLRLDARTLTGAQEMRT